jgi:RNA polymerase sigma factor (sigma-70 family)
VYTEAEIIEGCRKEIPKFQQIVYEKYAPKMMTICMRYTRNYEEARDLLHDGFIKVFMNFNSYREEANLDSWISRVVINNNINYLSKRSKKVEAEKYYTREINVEQEATWDETLFMEYSIEEINSAINSLLSTKKLVFNLYVFEGYSHKQIADLLGFTESASKSNLSRARFEIRNFLLQKSGMKR